ncbi:MAG TPA: hypothetical protein VN898_05480, partial [Candidatus Binatia bacterium]|nr:hypothetical protein [Candidatus Binatia bacterium]
CWSCRGTGGSSRHDYRWICQECDGSGQGRHLNLRLYRTVGFCVGQDIGPWRLAVVRNGVELWRGDPVILPALVWLGAGIVALIGLIVGLRGGVCPLCA